jgi:hypothetical protein
MLGVLGAWNEGWERIREKAIGLNASFSPIRVTILSADLPKLRMPNEPLRESFE